MMGTIPQFTRAKAYGVISIVQQQWQRYFQQANALRLATLYIETGQIMPAYSPAINSRPAIQAFWQGCFDMGIYAMPREPTKLDWLVGTVNEIGVYRFLDRSHRVIDVGKYVIIWKADQGRWKIQYDIWTSNLPAAP